MKEHPFFNALYSFFALAGVFIVYGAPLFSLVLFNFLIRGFPIESIILINIYFIPAIIIGMREVWGGEE